MSFPPIQYADGRVFVTFKKQISQTQFVEWITKFGQDISEYRLVHLEGIQLSIAVLNVPVGEENNWVERLGRDDLVSSARRDVLVTKTINPKRINL